MEAAIEIEYDVVRENYGEFIGVLRKKLAEYEPAGDRQSVVDYYHAPHPVLPRQRSPHRPARWIHVVLLVRDEGHATTLAIRDDNVYLVGFRNRRRQWYEFGFSGGRSARVLPAEWSSTFLECDVRYSSMVGGRDVVKRLKELGLGRWFARDAVRRLSGYEHGGTADERTRRHLARLIVMVCEAARMIPHFETVLDDWHRSTGAITERQVHLLWSWQLMSRAVLRWDWWSRYGDGTRRRQPQWPLALLAPHVDVRNVGQALQVVHLLLNWPDRPRPLPSSQPPPPPPPPQDTAADILRRLYNGGDSTIAHDLGEQQQGQGQCMLEIFGMRAGFSMRGTTVSVFDGMRGQIIYRNNDDKPDDDDELGRRRSMLGSLDHHDDVFGDSVTHDHQYGGYFGEWMLSGLRSIYDWAGLGRRSQTKTTTITGKRENGSTLVHDLVLTGPYRAISPYGSVSIEIDSPVIDTDSSSSNNVDVGISSTTDSIDVTDTDYVRIDISSERSSHHTDGRTTTLLLWGSDDADDAADDDDEEAALYDRVLTRTISTSHGPLDVTYAVLSNAVEATVQVRLLLAAADDILVHGRITAGCRDLDAQSLLFRRDAEEKVAVTADSDVPLSRSVVAVPLTSELLIMAALHTSVVASSSNYTAAAEGLLSEPEPEAVVARFRPELSGEDVQRFGIGSGSGEVEIKVTWALDF